MQISKFLKDGYLPEGVQLWEESQTLEYKMYQYPFSLERLNQIYALYGAWLNTTGGALFIGIIDRSCTVEGVNLNKTELAITKELLSIEKANIIPSPPEDCFRLTFIPVKSNQNSEKYVIRIEIMHGDKMTYYGRDTGNFNYIRMNQWNEKENTFEKVKLKINHLQRLDEDMNNLNNQPKFEFDNSFEFPSLSIEKPSEEALKKNLEIQRKNMGAKLKSFLQKRTTQGTLGYLDKLVGSVEDPDIYHIQNVWSGLKGIEELQDSVIQKLEKMIAISQPPPPKVVEQPIKEEAEEVFQKTNEPNNISKVNEIPKVNDPVQNKIFGATIEESKTNISEQNISKATENSLAWEKIEQLIGGNIPNNIPPLVVESAKTVVETKTSIIADPIEQKILPKGSQQPSNKNKKKRYNKKEFYQVVEETKRMEQDSKLPKENKNSPPEQKLKNHNHQPISNSKKKNNQYPKKEIFQTIFVAKSISSNQ